VQMLQFIYCPHISVYEDVVCVYEPLLFGFLFDQAPVLYALMDVPVKYCPIILAFILPALA
jgi:hypothetical protein